MEDKKIYLTKESLEQYKKRLTYLQEEARPLVIEEIKEARNQGDLSENAEYDAARDKQAAIENEILEIQHILENVVIIDEDTSGSHIVKIGSTVKALNLKNKEVLTVTIVGALDADPFSGKISNTSPLAKAILGHKVDETVEVEAAPKYKVKIESIM
ncbi:transcription elongation factor GreA [Mycoplasmopsis arginini]|uniref:Transcription elongation factor GreA n=1 Tax=Mycoplasmopsis arginini TaxID=2094 RepID=A0A449BH46_MYCAR|nr:transcription elongation factor GreA [Mycoplasmopsis arginini]SGA02105.1 transcript cleavage factor [Chlamydia abortus]ENY69586.1 Transcription elongation factor GreA (Transcript cleavage factor GreA) [Mycoplasmopsis arginini 7264]MCY2903055.1 transcription elongation factor GreA [Mycoplasmopsis arginini QMP CG1-2758]MDI3348554.1 transcription elongation factor GreA [Mycoplasmopsis arginini]MDI3348612.1 transcription elongation factor GreA [Mycoplasmopsis arginini]